MDIDRLEFKSSGYTLRDQHWIGQLSSPNMPIALLELTKRWEVTGNWTEEEFWELEQNDVEKLAKRLAEAIQPAVDRRPSLLNRLFGRS